MRMRLVALVAATTSMVLVAFLVPLALLVRSAAADRAVGSAVVAAQALAPAVASGDRGTLDTAVATANATGSYKVTVFLPGKRLVGAPATRSPHVDQAAAAAGRSFTADVTGGREILVAVAGLPGGTAVIRTFVSDEQLGRGVTRAWLVLGLLGLGLLAVSVLVADLLARTVIRPLSSVVEASHELASGNLSARAVIDGPSELREVGSGLNLLANRIGELLDRERETAADLSHRLRTPLTALRIDAESVPGAVDRARLLADVDAMQRTVDDVIRAARRPVSSAEPVCDAVAVVAERVAFWSALAEEENRVSHVVLPSGPLPVRLDDDDLSVCVDALLGNVFAHTPEGCDFAVILVARPGGGVWLTISDDGPGLPDPPALARGRSGAGSTGLGLDIVRRTIVEAGGTVTWGNRPAGGAMVRVDLVAPSDYRPADDAAGAAIRRMDVDRGVGPDGRRFPAPHR